MISYLGFHPSPHDSALSVKCSPSGRKLLSLYVDDIIITWNYVDEIAELKRHLAREFEMEDLVYLRYFLGIEVTFSPRGYPVSKSKYIADIIDHTLLS